MSALTSEVLAILYLLIFAALIRLRYMQPQRERPFRIQGGLAGAWIVAGTAMAALLFSFYVGILPPPDLTFISPARYVCIMLAGTFSLAFFPLLFLRQRRLKS